MTEKNIKPDELEELQSKVDELLNLINIITKELKECSQLFLQSTFEQSKINLTISISEFLSCPSYINRMSLRHDISYLKEFLAMTPPFHLKQLLNLKLKNILEFITI